MEVEKRKRLDDGEADGKKLKGSKLEADRGKKPVAEDGGDDGEVEEFFAILRRIHVAVKYFEKGNGGIRRQLTAKPWSPNFERGDFEGVKGVKGEDIEEGNVGLDLNSDPKTRENV